MRLSDVLYEIANAHFRQSLVMQPTPPRKPKNQDVRSREHLISDEVESLIQSAKKIGRHGHRDATLILLMYRHGLRVSEAIALRWDQVDYFGHQIQPLGIEHHPTALEYPVGGHLLAETDIWQEALKRR